MGLLCPLAQHLVKAAQQRAMFLLTIFGIEHVTPTLRLGSGSGTACGFAQPHMYHRKSGHSQS